MSTSSSKQDGEFGIKKDTTTLNVLMDALVKGDHVEHAHDALLEFKGLVPLKSDGGVPDTSFYGSLIFIPGKASRLKDACDVFDDMAICPRKGVVRDVVTYNTKCNKKICSYLFFNCSSNWLFKKKCSTHWVGSTEVG